MAGKIGALKAVLEASRPLALKTRAMAADIGQNLKGAVATGEQWYNQLKNIQGVKPGPLSAAYGHQRVAPMQMTKDEFLQSVINPKLYTQRAYLKDLDISDHRHELALDILHQDPDLRIIRDPRQVYAPNAYMQTPEYREALRRADNIIQSSGIVDNTYNVYEDAQTLNWQPQLYVPAKNWRPEDSQYFETVLRKAPKEGAALSALQSKVLSLEDMDNMYHFENPGQIAHARGQYYPKANSVFLHELQSDPFEALGKLKLRGTPGTEALGTPHGDMLKAVLLRASEGNADRVVVPSGEMITRIRDPQYRNFYEDVYDTQLAREVYSPLERLGIRIPEGAGGAKSIELTPEIRTNLNAYGLPFKKGGLAQACSCHQ